MASLTLDDLSFALPDSLIAQKPSNPRSSCRLMVVNRADSSITHHVFSEFPSFLRGGDGVVVNHSKVLPARVFVRTDGGARVELLYIAEGGHPREAWFMVRPGRKVKPGRTLFLYSKDGKYNQKLRDRDNQDGCKVEERDVDSRKERYRVKTEGHNPVSCDKSSEQSADGRLEVLQVNDVGHRLIRFPCDIISLLECRGEMPVPPYIKGDQYENADYRTAFEKGGVSLAAPTAGLHFDAPLISQIQEFCTWIEVRLDVGLGTFLPIKCDNPLDHKIHSESYTMSVECADHLNRVRGNGGRIIACGTTSLRVLESVALKKNGQDYFFSCKGDTELFVYPGFQFRAVDALLTNFHLPHSSLLLLVWAFTGMELAKRAYEEAIKEGYRFYSFGDAMLII